MKWRAYILLLVSGFLTHRLIAQQNLIYNGDFELYDTCPTSVSTPGDNQLVHCLGWTIPNTATSDYLNSCASWPAGVPNNIVGYQYPYSGDGYCGVIIQNCSQPSCNGWWVEYIQSKLVTPLIAGFEYEFTCRIVLSDLINEFSWSEFGALFTTYPIAINTSKPFQNNMVQVKNQTGNYLTDTLNWIDFRSTFIAQGGEEFITIGFFIDTLNPDTLRFTNFFIDPTNYGSYYFIDSCSLTETGNVFDYPNVFTPNNDGTNDFWTPFYMEEDEIVLIFNRWGEIVDILNGSNPNWYGRVRVSGIKCSEGVYYFVTNKNRNGTIQLLR